ncbi:MAG: bifunctional 5,10-methylenetetrahydrofolate dehydrogenase/5,10-methenyltetrahydrofolate cyclohydrolase [Chloroflexota bacterium]|nr:bifunctional 5,10-methylenetetrahydrofolate dehydrogenase/5,10-methenyltetrahydrofolate cyclohydrolase [Chloroflexota bacterium]
MTDTLSSAVAAADWPSDGALILDGRALAAELRVKAATEVADLKRRFRVLPGLAVVMVGDDPASHGYLRMIRKTCQAVDLPLELIELPAHATRSLIQAEVARLNVLHSVAGVIVQMPLPPPHGPETVSAVLDPAKDVDGIHPENAGRLTLGYSGLDYFVPPTPQAGLALLARHNIALAGKTALVIGRSAVVGRPLGQMLQAANATVILTHSYTPPAVLRRLLGEADVVACAVGKPDFVRGAWLKPGAVVLDFGAGVVDGVMCGDVEFATARHVAGVITPVPGGIGPVTNLMLVQNTIKAARRMLHEWS